MHVLVATHCVDGDGVGKENDMIFTTKKGVSFDSEGIQILQLKKWYIRLKLLLHYELTNSKGKIVI